MTKYMGWIKTVVFLLCLVPVGGLAYLFYNTTHELEPNLGANPLEYLTHGTGDWTLYFILLTLAITPLRKVLNQPWLIQLRKMLGLFAFFYGCLHFTCWLWFDKQFVWSDMFADVLKRKFVTAGMLALLLMLPLAVTSTTWAIRKMGGKNWSALHRLVYITGIAAVVHYIWLVKADLTKPLEYTAILAVLLGYRVVEWAKKRASRSGQKAVPQAG